MFADGLERPDEAFALHERRAKWLEGYPDHLRLWSDYFLDGEGFGVFLERLNGIRANRPEIAPAVIYVLVINRPHDAPFSPSLPRGAGPWFSVGMYFMAARHNPVHIAGIGALSRELRNLAADLGAVAYGYGWEP